MSHRAWARGSARRSGLRRANALGRVKRRPVVDVAPLSPCCKRCGQKQTLCGACGTWWCAAPGHAAHRCGLTPQVCQGCWRLYYVGPGEPAHRCEVVP